MSSISGVWPRTSGKNRLGFWSPSSIRRREIWFRTGFRFPCGRLTHDRVPASGVAYHDLLDRDPEKLDPFPNLAFGPVGESLLKMVSALLGLPPPSYIFPPPGADALGTSERSQDNKTTGWFPSPPRSGTHSIQRRGRPTMRKKSVTT